MGYNGSSGGKFDHDLIVLPNPGIMVYLGEIIPKWPELFSLVKHYNLPRYNGIYEYPTKF